jgi:hypothetical protein
MQGALPVPTGLGQPLCGWGSLCGCICCPNPTFAVPTTERTSQEHQLAHLESAVESVKDESSEQSSQPELGSFPSGAG